MESPYSRRRRRPFLFPFFLFAFLAITGIVYWLWNNVLVDVTTVKRVTYWQAMGLLILSRILVGGFRFGPPKGGHSWKEASQLREKWRSMSEEERARFKSEWRRRGPWGHKGRNE
ncbi:hypothetical protein GCM10028807_43010 [Spirosoma daeguense]